MSDLNKAQLIGRLGSDPEIRHTSNGDAVATLSVATGQTWKDRNTGEKKEKTEWHRLVAFGKLAEIIGEYLKQGSQAYFDGRLQTRSYEQDGVTKWTTEIVVQNMQMLDTRRPAENQQQEPAPTGRPPQEAPNNYGEFDDDIPF